MHSCSDCAVNISKLQCILRVCFMWSTLLTYPNPSKIRFIYFCNWLKWIFFLLVCFSLSLHLCIIYVPIVTQLHLLPHSMSPTALSPYMDYIKSLMLTRWTLHSLNIKAKAPKSIKSLTKWVEIVEISLNEWMNEWLNEWNTEYLLL